MKNKIIIFDETNGEGAKGRTMKWIAERYDIEYVTSAEELISILKDKEKK